MRRTTGHCILRFCLCLSVMFFTAVVLKAGDTERLDLEVYITLTKGTRYQLLRDVSEKTGLMFVYDSQIIDNDEKIKILKGTYTVREAIYAITGNKALEINLIGNHVILSLPVEEKPLHATTVSLTPESAHSTISGYVFDLYSNEPVVAVSVGVKGSSICTITNRDGVFRITIPDSLLNSGIWLSHIGYESIETEISILADKYTDFGMEPKVLSLQEVVVRAVNPLYVIQGMLRERHRNYANNPVYFTAFYRESVEHKKKNIDLTEAVLKIYKTGYQKVESTDQVKLIKMRRILDLQEKDSLLTKVKSGIQSSLLLDIIKNPPDFLTFNDVTSGLFDYTHTDISTVDDRLVNVISFEQKKGLKDPLYKGQLFIDTENHALVEARFEINPEYVEKATDMFVEKKGRRLKFTLRKATYLVSYKPSEDGYYYVNHTRGEMEFRVRRKGRLFANKLKIWFELVNCKVDLENVQPFPRSERLSTRTIFSNIKSPYDAGFWRHFNIVEPEEHLKELILYNLNEITEPE